MNKDKIKWQGSDDLSEKLMPIDQLTLDPNNTREHSDRNIEAIARSLAKWGQVKPIVVWENNKATFVVAGNGTVISARALGWTHVAVTNFHGSYEDAIAYAIADNRTAELAEWDLPELATQFKKLVDEGWDLDDLGWAQHEWAPLLDAEWEPREPKEKSDDDGDSPNIRVFFIKEQWDVVVRALALLRQGGDYTDGEALAVICSCWIDAEHLRREE